MWIGLVMVVAVAAGWGVCRPIYQHHIATREIQMPGPDSERNEAVVFFESLSNDFDTAHPIHWHYLLKNVPEESVEPLIQALTAIGFNEVEALFDDDQEGSFILGCTEERLHTADSFAGRVATIEAFAARNGLILWDYSAGRE
jgi:hypothetical protein